MTNRLIHEKSPYLLQHANNPVQWHPWGPEAFETARRQGKHIFLSIGYATCHWCHVMEAESFEDPDTAKVLNDSFVCIKVDREERPDIDTVYMTACQMVTGSGGWPLNIVMTAEKQPFFAGTYIPKVSRFGRLGLQELCTAITAMASSDPARIQRTAEALTDHVAKGFRFESGADGRPDADILDRALDDIVSRYDDQFGGFDSAPKFPMPHRLLFLLRAAGRNNDEKTVAKVCRTLTAMRLGGLWDHVGYGFHRYATDRQWLLPHFEKMLYDQALLALTYLDAYTLTGDTLFRETVEEILTYVQRDMTSPEKGFYSAQDADSEGVEGKYYVWDYAELESIVAGIGDGLDWNDFLNARPEGNFRQEATQEKTGANILHFDRPLSQWAQKTGVPPDEMKSRWQALRERLFEHRRQRVAPLLDDKIITDWNGLMIVAFARAGRLLEDQRYTDAAGDAAAFVLDTLRDENGRLMHRFRQGQAALSATANDYAFFIQGLLELYRTSSQRQWLSHAEQMQRQMTADFWDKDDGGFFLTAADQNDLPVRPKELYDGAIPSANAMALMNLLRLSRCGGGDWRQQAAELIKAFKGSVAKQPMAFTHTLNGWELALRDRLSSNAAG